ncbi:D-alanine aminotransferase [Alteromonas sediminis]|uniref:Aminodeoxychorismate lyase n=1 Tax=Alteromonas sediminis TaxID=2259342 RepID=A0A3N5Y2D4_9ALTE|nr:aminotransferase class IV [Alteromonas sediminis]RPJ67510.1 D-alanine aminotransferase [Alteromonas sediminis]
MTVAFLNDQWMALEEAKISPLDRGFLYGDGVYEVIPVHKGQPVALNAHVSRLTRGLSDIKLHVNKTSEEWRSLIIDVVTHNQRGDEPADYTAIYLHVSRGADTKRHHAFPQGITPTVFAFSFDIPPPPPKQRENVNCLQVGLSEDKRWKRCHIKSTSLLGNVLHYQAAAEQGLAETILYNEHRQVTEASSCNVFAVIAGIVVTPPLDLQLLPGITRLCVIQALKSAHIPVEERVLTVEELLRSDEVWLTSSTKEIAPVSQVDGHLIGDGRAGEYWERAINALDNVKFTL